MKTLWQGISAGALALVMVGFALPQTAVAASYKAAHVVSGPSRPSNRVQVVHVTKGPLKIAGGGASGKVTFNDLPVTKKVNTASPELFKNYVSGAHYKDVVIQMRKAGGSVMFAGTTNNGGGIIKSQMKDVLPGGAVPPKQAAAGDGRSYVTGY